MGIKAVMLAVVFAGVAQADVIFVERGKALGLTHQYTGGWEYFVGGGVASFDCDGDLLPELFVAGGAGPAILLRNTSTRHGEVSLVEQTPDALSLTGVTGAYPLDINSDGTLDLFIMRLGENQILAGGPDCSFTPLAGLGFDGGSRWTTAFSATWEAGNTLPTLAIGNYVDRDDPEGPFEACDINLLMRPENGRYITTPLAPAFCPLSMLFSDWGHSGQQDLRISNDRHYYVRDGAEQMWAMENSPRLYSATEGWKEYSIWGMGIASRDISGDGRPEVFLTSMGDQKLQMPDVGQQGPAYSNATFESGSTAHRPYTGGDGRPSTGWHVQFGDVDNDGLDDVFIAKGNVEQMPDSAMADPNNLLMQGADGSFSEHGMTAGIASMDRSRGAALLDLNLDGLLDLVVVNRRAPLEVYQNTTVGSGNWLLLDLRQTGVNPQAVGGWIELSDGEKTWHREVTVGGGHASGDATLVHFGVGLAADLRMRVNWPDGVVSAWVEVEVNEVVRVLRAGNALSISPI